MRTFFLLLCLVISNIAFGQKSDDSSKSSRIYSTDFISVAVPTIYNGTIKYLKTDGTIQLADVDTIPHDNTLLRSLSKTESTVTVYKSNENGSISLLGTSLSGKNETYVVIYDFVQSQAFTADDSTNSKKIIGIGVRMVAEVFTKKRNIDLADIFKIALSAEKGKVSGSLEVKIVGIGSQKINQAIPVTADLSQASIAAALQSVATIKSHIYDKETIITPYLIGFSIPPTGSQENIAREIELLGL